MHNIKNKIKNKSKKKTEFKREIKTINEKKKGRESEGG